MYQTGPAICGGNVWNSFKKQKNIVISRWSNGRQLKGADGTLLQFNFWRSGCYKGRSHAGSRSGGSDGTGGRCGSRWFMNNYVRLVSTSPNGESPTARSYGICGTPGKGRGRDNINTGLNTGTQSGRHDPPRDKFFYHVKLPGVAEFARKETNAKIDYRSYFWCKDSDNEFM